jgi:hypothetical protein
MRTRMAVPLLLAAVVLAAVTALRARSDPRAGAVAQSVRPASGAPSPAATKAATTTAADALTPVDLERLRDVFRFADERPPTETVPRLEPVPAVGVGPPEATGPRLVGLVRRGGRLLAALSRDGEVALMAPGESGAGWSFP